MNADLDSEILKAMIKPTILIELENHYQAKKVLLSEEIKLTQRFGSLIFLMIHS